ncbi:hypothetical protein [Bosea sp. PAMC 26642]|uniref:hypothetical protein n=1 Tax=Bosea sp. (strain PAMC 26642) TaxID=1792307 RepID=UPI0009E98C9F|nr:hypothetical protein [Bosea sp. PAMC 26642]
MSVVAAPAQIGPPKLKFATIYIAEIATGQLSSVDLKKKNHALRMDLRRAGMASTVVFGNVEVAYIARTKRWLLHAHLILRDPSAASLALLDDKAWKAGGDGALKIEKVTNPLRQFSYCLKFPLYHRPGKGGARRARAYSIPKAALSELLAWLSRHDPKEFVFLQRLRWAGRKLALAPTKVRSDRGA